MNNKQILAAVLALIGTASFAAGEDTQTQVPSSTLTRAAVQAQARVALPTTGAIVISNHEATEFRDQVGPGRSRADVRAEARAAARDHKFNSLYVGG